jgi:hypothetical protein
MEKVDEPNEAALIRKHKLQEINSCLIKLTSDRRLNDLYRGRS